MALEHILKYSIFDKIFENYCMYQETKDKNLLVESAVCMIDIYFKNTHVVNGKYLHLIRDYFDGKKILCLGSSLSVTHLLCHLLPLDILFNKNFSIGSSYKPEFSDFSHSFAFRFLSDFCNYLVNEHEYSEKLWKPGFCRSEISLPNSSNIKLTKPNKRSIIGSRFDQYFCVLSESHNNVYNARNVHSLVNEAGCKRVTILGDYTESTKRVSTYNPLTIFLNDPTWTLHVFYV